MILQLKQMVLKEWDKLSRKLDAERTKTVEAMADRLSGLGATVNVVKIAMMESFIAGNKKASRVPLQWSPAFTDG